MLLYVGSEIIHISANDILAVWFLQSVHVSHVVADKTSMGILANIDAIGAHARLRHRKNKRHQRLNGTTAGRTLR